MLVTNVADLTPPEVVQRYKALADIERGFRVLKSEIEIAPPSSTVHATFGSPPSMKSTT
jgi:transposase